MNLLYNIMEFKYRNRKNRQRRLELLKYSCYSVIEVFVLFSYWSIRVIQVLYRRRKLSKKCTFCQSYFHIKAQVNLQSDLVRREESFFFWEKSSDLDFIIVAPSTRNRKQRSRTASQAQGKIFPFIGFRALRFCQSVRKTKAVPHGCE